MVSSKGAGGAIDGFIEGRQGGRKQGTPHAQWDMRGISPAICRGIFTCDLRDKGYKRIDKFNSNKAEQQQQRNIAAREAALEHLSIKQQFGYADHTRMYDFAERGEDAPIHTIDASIAHAPITEYSEYNEYPEYSQFNTEVVVSSCAMRKVFIFWCEIFADYATIYNSINRLLRPPPPRDPRPRGGHSSRHPVVA